jgi:hypothetical protein
VGIPRLGWRRGRHGRSTAILGHYHGSAGAAAGLLTGGVVNMILAIIASNRRIEPVPILPNIGPALATAAACLAIGAAATAAAGVLGGTTIACVIYVTIAARQDNDLVRLVRGWLKARR